ncbi:MAG: DEAD/DEAH box helicase [Aeromonas sp.]
MLAPTLPTPLAFDHALFAQSQLLLQKLYFSSSATGAQLAVCLTAQGQVAVSERKAELDARLEALEAAAWIKPHGTQRWTLTCDGMLALILAAQHGLCALTLPSEPTSTQALIFAFSQGAAAELIAPLPVALLSDWLDSPLLVACQAGLSEAWQQVLDHQARWQQQLDAHAMNDSVSQWLFAPADEVALLSAWPALSAVLAAGSETALHEALTQAQAEPAAETSLLDLLLLGWWQCVDLPAAARYQRYLSVNEAFAADLLKAYGQGRVFSAQNLFDSLQLPLAQVPWGYLWLDLCLLASQGAHHVAQEKLRQWDLSEVLQAPPAHRLMAQCQDRLRLLQGQPPLHAPLRVLRVNLESAVTDDADSEAKPASGNWLNWLQGLGRASGVPKVQERLMWQLLAEGRELECRLQKTNAKGEWTAGRRIDVSVLASQYPALLAEEDWALVRLLSAGASRLPAAIWPLLARHPRLCNSKGQPLQLALRAPLLQLVPVDSGLSARLYPASCAAGASILPLAPDLWQVSLAPAQLLAKLPALSAIPPLDSAGYAALQSTLDSVPGLPWYSDDLQLKGNASLAPWPGQAVVQLDWRKGQLNMALVTRQDELPTLPLGSGESMVPQAWVPTAERSAAPVVKHYWQRDLLAEREQAEQLRAQLGLALAGRQWRFEGEEALGIITALPQWVAAGVPIDWHPDSNRLKKLEETALSLRIEQRQEWFQVEGDLRLDEGQVLDLRLILRQLTPGARTVQLDEQTSIVLSDQLAERLTTLGSMLDDEQRFTRQLAYPLRQLLSAISNQGDAGWQALQTQWQTPAECPLALLELLRDYQKEGVYWLANLAQHGFGACLADDMGLGKTLQALTLLRLRASDGPALVVVPKSVVTNWQEEVLRFAPELNVVAFDNPAKRPELIRHAKAGDIILLNYGMLAGLSSALKAQRWASIVLDEAQQIKNASTLRAKLLFQLSGDFRLALSGTPIENHLGELWSLFSFINPGLLGSQSEFKRRFGKAAKDAGHMARLRAIISPFILRRLKQEVLTELPAKTEIVHHIALSSEERELYEATRREVVAQVQSSDGRTLMHVLSGLTRLRRLCCSPELVMPAWPHTASKLDEAMALLAEAIEGGHRVLVFSQFVDLLSLLRARIETAGWDYCYLDGGCSAKSRQQSLLRFRAEPVPLFLISLKAGGTGLNLTQADTVLHLDPWWNPAVEDQASDRAHRMGQTQPVTVYRLVCEQTVEEKIVALHGEKRALADGLLSGQSDAAALDVESLRSLLMG